MQMGFLSFEEITQSINEYLEICIPAQQSEGQYVFEYDDSSYEFSFKNKTQTGFQSYQEIADSINELLDIFIPVIKREVQSIFEYSYNLQESIVLWQANADDTTHKYVEKIAEIQILVGYQPANEISQSQVFRDKNQDKLCQIEAKIGEPPKTELMIPYESQILEIFIEEREFIAMDHLFGSDFFDHNKY